MREAYASLRRNYGQELAPRGWRDETRKAEGVEIQRGDSMRAIRKPLMMRGMVLIHYIVMVALFAVCWQQFYSTTTGEHIFSVDSLSV